MKTLFELRDTLVPLAAVVLAYILGQSQGREQTRYQESARVVVELRRKMHDIVESFPYPVLTQEQDPLDFLPTTPLYRWLRDTRTARRLGEFGALVLLARKLSDLEGYYEANKPWLSPEICEKVGPVFRSFYEETVVLYNSSGHYPRDWESLRRREEEFGSLVGELDVEARRLIDTSRGRSGWHWWRRGKW